MRKAIIGGPAMQITICSHRGAAPGLLIELIPQGLKPGLVWLPDARAEARAYLRNNGKCKGKSDDVRW
jgi:hypothetical protein